MYSKGGFCFDLFQFILGLREFREDVILRLLSAYLEARPARILRNFANGTTTQTYIKITCIKILKKLSKAIQNFWGIPYVLTDP